MSTEEFPKTFVKGETVRVVGTPADQVSVEFDGFVEKHDVDIDPEDPAGFTVDPVVDVPAPKPSETRRERASRERAEAEAAQGTADVDSFSVNTDGEVSK